MEPFIIILAVVIGLLLTGMAWLHEGVKYWRNPRKRKEVKFPKFVILMVLSFTVSSNIVMLYKIIPFALLSDAIDDITRIPLLLGALTFAVFTCYSLIRMKKAKI